MKSAITVVAILFLAAAAALGQTISISGPNREAMLEGNTYHITWEADGVESVSVVVHGTRTSLGVRPRGDFDMVLAESEPADAGGIYWTVPWVDAKEFFIKLKGYDQTGQITAIYERGYGFRPAVLAKRTKDGIYLDLSKRTDQRLYVQRDYRITHAYLSSSSESYLWRAPGRHIKVPHDHAGVFRVLSKSVNHYSVLFEVDMPYALRYHGGHFIHATSRNLYRNLGEPASHGCNRLTFEDAKELYEMTPLGTRVEVIGPKG